MRTVQIFTSDFTVRAVAEGNLAPPIEKTYYVAAYIDPDTAMPMALTGEQPHEAWALAVLEAKRAYGVDAICVPTAYEDMEDIAW